MSDLVVRDDVSRFGLRRRHFVNVLLPVDRDLALAEISGEGVDIKAIIEYEDLETHVQHLRIYWTKTEA